MAKHLTGKLKYSAVWNPNLGNGRFRNPVLFMDYSDPDVVRKGSDFFMAASSFSCFPGIPILHSSDLVNWTIIGHVFDRLPFEDYEAPAHGKGAWAPSIRYHGGVFWVYFATPDEGIFMSKTRDPFCGWEPLVHVKKTKGWIDPCPFWDDDGQAYLIHAYANSRIGIKSKLNLCRMKEDGTALEDDGEIVFDGTLNHPTIEGPKLYKRNGYYYIFAPAGGVKEGWQTVLRSRTIYGPYEDRIVLHQGNSAINGPHQGGLVELDTGESWFLHFQDRAAFGRVVHLQPVRWEDGWPKMGEDSNKDGIGEPVLEWQKPKMKSGDVTEPASQTSDDFTSENLSLQWQWQANPKEEWYSLQARPGHLRLYSRHSPDRFKLGGMPNLVMQKFPGPGFTATVKLTLYALSETIRAGLAVMGKEYAYLGLSKSENEGHVIAFYKGSIEDAGNEDIKTEEHPVSDGMVYLRVQVDEKAVCRFSYSQDHHHFTAMGDVFQAVPGIWIGAKVGMYCADAGTDGPDGSYCDFDWFIVSQEGDGRFD
ncbi:glycoside hydrolase 43 family protein [Bacillus sonorensis]|uniref:glycoside hydrolase family 43 protein n=1 Tax=Bacillus sonorensis TaxID=119858 RepID=UPI00049803CA|nr:glycoside hydrolase 43 family protein [Bacillus sonorensis]MBG9916380.1 glycoside hydrolase [Bacillus sonorensis]MCY7855061.1 glycoside hydrolase 43 family protein [Bacillus sonorensis]MCY8027838.1 glycoside hydrolase 43 family protein [Bacillus sonorensis]MCY8036458.1 glycoside hydrolase 43 family protein [Bacillus sonorensis]MCY8090164.1 glycoside hydrolase 43 family protein [Bacillus sonorensis]